MSFHKLFLHSPVRYVLAVLLSAAVAAACLATQGHTLRVQWANALTTAGAVTALVGMLQCVAFYGAFDTFRFSFSSLGNQRPNKDYFEYLEEKKEQRSHQNLVYVPFIAVGLLVLAVGVLVGLGLW